jgi:hypothetical protein
MANSIDKLLDIAEYFDKTAAKKDIHGDFIFPKTHAKVKDKKDHFPIQNANHARNALGQAGKFTEAPKWFIGTLKELQSAIRRRVKAKFPDVKVSDKKKKKAGLEEFLVKIAEKEFKIEFLPGEVGGYIQIALEDSGGDYSYDESGSTAYFTSSERDAFLKTLCDALEDELVEEDEKDKIEALFKNLPPEFTAWPDPKTHTMTPDDYEECSMCGFDHEYEPEESNKWHSENPYDLETLLPIEDGNNSNLPDDYEECSTCGFDHGYDPENANKWHTENPHDLETLLPIEKDASEFDNMWNFHPNREKMHRLEIRFKELERKFFMGEITPREKAELDKISLILENASEEINEVDDISIGD